MSKTVRNILIAVGVVVVVAIAAIPISKQLLPASNSGDPTTTSPQSTIPDVIPEDPTEAETEAETQAPTEGDTEADEPATSLSNVKVVQTTKKPSSSSNPTTKAPTTTKPTPEEIKSGKDTLGMIAGGLDASGEPERSLLSYAYDVEGDYFYTETDAWQRQFGFNTLYDQGGALIVMYYDTLRIRFVYDGLEWQIQLWKGQYGFLFLGAEIGVYHRPEGSTNGTNIDHFQCATDENMLDMHMQMYNKGDLVLQRPYKKYWWCTGFITGRLDRFSDRSQLVVAAQITFKSNEMAKLFADGLAANGFKQVSKINVKNVDTYQIAGKDVAIVWKNIKHSLNGK